MRDTWQAAPWDAPNGTPRYCVRRPDPATIDGWHYAQGDREPVALFDSMSAAQNHAAELNGRAR